MSGESERAIHNQEESTHRDQNEGSQATQTIDFMHKADDPNTVEEGQRHVRDATANPNQSESTPPSQTMSLVEPLPALHTPHRKRKTILMVGLVLATLDLCCLPITYYYALKFDTSLNVQDGKTPRSVKCFKILPDDRLVQYSPLSLESMGCSVSHTMLSAHSNYSDRKPRRNGGQ